MDTKSRNHLETLNREMGEVKTDMGWLKEAVVECNTKIASVDTRTWYILGTLIISILIQIGFKLWA